MTIIYPKILKTSKKQSLLDRLVSHWTIDKCDECMRDKSITRTKGEVEKLCDDCRASRKAAKARLIDFCHNSLKGKEFDLVFEYKEGRSCKVFIKSRKFPKDIWIKWHCGTLKDAVDESIRSVKYYIKKMSF